MNDNKEKEQINIDNNYYVAPPSDMLSLLSSEKKESLNHEEIELIDELPIIKEYSIDYKKNNNNILESDNILEVEHINNKVEPPETIKDENNKENSILIESLMKNVKSPKIELEKKTKKENKIILGISILSGLCFVGILLFVIFSEENLFNFGGSTVYYQNKTIENVGEYQTVVVTDNIYEGVKISNRSDAVDLIEKDSNNQKIKCYNDDVKKIESNIESKYGIIAVNLCEVNFEFAKEIQQVIDTIYKEYPSIEGHLTNLTLINAPSDSPYIASFSSAKLFAKSSTKSTYPNVYKMSIYLNATYFLDPDRLSYEVELESNVGYFPKNATRYSIVAHEFGHYLSFLAHLNNSKLDDLILLTKKNYSNYSQIIKEANNGSFSLKMIEEAYNNYKEKNPYKFYNIDAFRASISDYAVVTDNNGNYIYDETIAEAFHDYYLNRDKAQDASKEIIKVLKKYLSN